MHAWETSSTNISKGKSKESQRSLTIVVHKYMWSNEYLSHGKNMYFILFIDNLTLMKGVYFIRKTFELFYVFKNFKALDEKQSGRFIKVLKMTWQQSMSPINSKKYCKNEGVERHLLLAIHLNQMVYLRGKIKLW